MLMSDIMLLPCLLKLGGGGVRMDLCLSVEFHVMKMAFQLTDQSGSSMRCRHCYDARVEQMAHQDLYRSGSYRCPSRGQSLLALPRERQAADSGRMQQSRFVDVAW